MKLPAEEEGSFLAGSFVSYGKSRKFIYKFRENIVSAHTDNTENYFLIRVRQNPTAFFISYREFISTSFVLSSRHLLAMISASADAVSIEVRHGIPRWMARRLSCVKSPTLLS